MEIKELAEKAIADLKEMADIKDGAKAVKDAWTSESNILKKAFKAVAAAVALISDVVEHVEVIGVDAALAGAQKKELAVEIINKLIDIPYVPEAAEGVLIDFTVDAIVGAFNKKFGKGWLAKIA